MLYYVYIIRNDEMYNIILKSQISYKYTLRLQYIIMILYIEEITK